jgi:DNA polymerase sigma
MSHCAPSPEVADAFCHSLIDFFRYYSHDFQYNNTVISIRAGHLTKESKGWMNDVSASLRQV